MLTSRSEESKKYEIPLAFHLGNNFRNISCLQIGKVSDVPLSLSPVPKKGLLSRARALDRSRKPTIEEAKRVVVVVFPSFLVPLGNSIDEESSKEVGNWAIRGAQARIHSLSLSPCPFSRPFFPPLLSSDRVEKREKGKGNVNVHAFGKSLALLTNGTRGRNRPFAVATQGFYICFTCTFLLLFSAEKNSASKPGNPPRSHFKTTFSPDDKCMFLLLMYLGQLHVVILTA